MRHLLSSILHVINNKALCSWKMLKGWMVCVLTTKIIIVQGNAYLLVRFSHSKINMYQNNKLCAINTHDFMSIKKIK